MTTKLTRFAVVPSPVLQRERDVLNSVDIDATQSPYPFGLRVLAVGDGGGGGGGGVGGEWGGDEMLPMFYVSDEVAKARLASGMHGVQAGWYVQARPGQRYELEVVCVNASDKCVQFQPGEDVSCVSMLVDGQSLRGHSAFEPGSTGGRTRWVGFKERSSTVMVNGEARRLREYRPLIFASVTKHDDAAAAADDEAEKRGAIEMVVHLGRRRTISLGQQRSWTNRELTNGQTPTASVHEKTAIKKGVSLTTRTTGSVAHYDSSSAIVDRTRRIDAARVRVLVREEKWLKSRDIIPKNEHPLGIVPGSRRGRRRAAAASKYASAPTGTDQNDSDEVSVALRSSVEPPPAKRTRRANGRYSPASAPDAGGTAVRPKSEVTAVGEDVTRTGKKRPPIHDVIDLT